ncbi:unnamed protein product [Brassicogethes aeneus]|uniref:Epoxide hydrolase n=1 Tax=Brassicogethes aeneus TaxID=1431903 RepID=A0A9P0AQB5_BRAAE|nr:unnamed protein product [Brassicogethes aeneus]
MDWISKGFLILLVILVTYLYNLSQKVPDLPEFEDTWWGVGKEQYNEESDITPFKISLNDKDLHKQLSSYKITQSLDGTNHEYGINTNLLEDIIEHWHKDYNWTQRKKYLNKFPQFTVKVQGLKIHFIRLSPKIDPTRPPPSVLPLMLLHGWPSSVREFYDVIPLLNQHKPGVNFVFDIIVPSLPNSGFSDATRKPGLGLIEHSVLLKNFMLKLGFPKFYVHGGDWGAAIAQTIATLYPDHLFGIHSTRCLVNRYSDFKIMMFSLVPSLIIAKEKTHKLYPVLDKVKFLLSNFGYLHMQAHKPDAIGVALNDSPVGLAAYILDKFIESSDVMLKDGGLKNSYKFDALIDNLMIYWVTGKITNSMRIFAETFNKRNFDYQLDLIPTEVPTACTRFTQDIFYYPETILMDKFFKLVHINDLDVGHFPGYENPELLAQEIWKAINRIEEVLRVEEIYHVHLLKKITWLGPSDREHWLAEK